VKNARRHARLVPSVERSMRPRPNLSDETSLRVTPEVIVHPSGKSARHIAMNVYEFMRIGGCSSQ
jgi:hypothetical protein